MTNSSKKLEIDLPKVKSKILSWISFSYNVVLGINALFTLVLTFIDDDWKESHNFDFITKILQWSLGLLIFLWVLFNMVIPKIKERILKAKIEFSPEKIKSRLEKTNEKIKTYMEKHQQLIDMIKKYSNSTTPTIK